jgi:AcrR family transcriptional regulator
MAQRPHAGFPMSELVRRTGVPPATVRYYVSVGVVPPPRRVARNRFLYDERHVESVRLVRLLRERRQMPLDAIARVLPELFEASSGEVFRPEMWDQLVEAHTRSVARTSPAARLLEAGRLAFNRQGYADVRVEDVCEAARVAKGSFYRHFASKEELFFAASVEAADQAAREMEAGAGDEPLLVDEAVERLAVALQPNLALLLDLLAMAAQRRPGHGRVLRQVFTNLYRAVRSQISLAAPASAAEEVLERALLVSLRRVVVSPLLDAELRPGEAGV